MADEKTVEKTPVQIEREKINVTVESKTDPKTEAKEGDENKEGEDSVEGAAANDTVAGAEGNDTTAGSDDDEDEELDEKTKKLVNRFEKRIGKEVAKRKQLEEQALAKISELEQKLAAKEADGKVLTEADVERLANAKAAQTVYEKQFEKDCNTLGEAAKNLDKNFDTKVKAMAEDVEPIPNQMVGILADLSNGAQVLVHLTNNIEDAERLFALKANPVKMAVETAKLATKLASKPPKQVSKVPPPQEPVGGNKSSPETLSDNMSMEDFVKLRNKQADQRRKAKMGMA